MLQRGGEGETCSDTRSESEGEEAAGEAQKKQDRAELPTLPYKSSSFPIQSTSTGSAPDNRIATMQYQPFDRGGCGSLAR